MSEEDYTTRMQRDDVSLSDADLVAAYERGIAELRDALAGMAPEQLRARPIAGKWSTLEVVAHLVSTELFFTERIERALALDRPLLLGVDEATYPARLNYQSLDFTVELDFFCSMRRHLAGILRLQPADAWRRTAIHSGTGLVTVRQLVFQAVRHLRHHLPFIAEKRAALAQN